MATPMRILVALSGGVDSSTVLALLHRHMHQGSASNVATQTAPLSPIQHLEAAYIKTWLHEENPIGPCSWEADVADARAVCQKLGVPFQVINLIGDYEQHVVKMLVEGYARGLTPNPDIACNRFIKFGAFLEIALRQNFTHLATGHYAQNRLGEDGLLYQLHLATDTNKDQSYFLAQLSQPQLAHALFPLGGLAKPQVRQLAAQFGLPNAAKRDSQGICFLGRVKINDFLARYLPDSPGPIINLEGRELGRHRGLHHYTLGQRHGMGIPSNIDHQHYVVIAKDFANNTLRVGFDHPATPGLYAQEFSLHHLHAVHPVFQASTLPQQLTARPRYRDALVPCTLSFTSPHSAMLTFATPQRALASGQLVAFHSGTHLIGSGIYL